MTVTGNITAFNRFGLNKLNRGPLEKASFEKVLSELTEAAVFNDKDTLHSISSSIITGKIFQGGTGLVHLLLNEKAFTNTSNNKENKKPLKEYLRLISS